MLNPAASLALAEHVAESAKRVGFDTALIGAAALAVHRYTRGTEDIDLAACVDPHTKLTALARALVAEGLQCDLRFPDDEDPLGGVLVVWAGVDEDGEPIDVVEVVNFHNPARIVCTPAHAAIMRSQPLPETSLRCVTLQDLIALKLYAGGLSDHADIVQLLVHNPHADLAEIRSVASTFDTQAQLQLLFDQAKSYQHGRK
jgi:hypothetical protein